MKQLHLPDNLDEVLGRHGHQQGLSNGWLITVWVAFILSTGNHCKSHVQEWAWKHHQTLEMLIGQTIRWQDFNDDRLGIALKYLSQPKAWAILEATLWQSTLVVHKMEVASVRLDSTAASGYHTPREDGLMQLGHSKDHRPDLAQLKLMAAVAEPNGQLIACDVVAGQQADDPLYLPLIARVRQIVGHSGLLYTGDCKMAALSSRADIAEHQDYYLTVLPQIGDTVVQLPQWVEQAFSKDQPLEFVCHKGRLLGCGYEFTRILTVANHSWSERVLLFRSLSLAQVKMNHLTQRLSQAESALFKLTPERGRGKRQFQEETLLQEAVDQLLTHYEVKGLLTVTWERQEQQVTHFVGRGRGGANRPTCTETKVRYAIKSVSKDEVALKHWRDNLGWRVYVTNMPSDQMSLTESVLHYRTGVCIERDFHLIKDSPIGLSKLYVRTDEQIQGLTHLLTLALRVLTLIENQVRDGLTKTDAVLVGLYEGQPTRTTARPTGIRLLRAFARAELAVVHYTINGQAYHYLTPLSGLLLSILELLDLPPSTYTQLGHNSS